MSRGKGGNREFRSGCPIASTLDIVGDRWTLVLLRDLVNGKTRVKQFLESPERIASNILNARLAAMEADGLIARHPYQLRPRRHEYRLTKKGAALFPILREITRWGESNLPERWKAPAAFMRRRVRDLA